MATRATTSSPLGVRRSSSRSIAPRAEELPGLLEQWGVDYVLVGGLERNKYKISEAAVARFDAALKLVYDQDGVRIYAR